MIDEIKGPCAGGRCTVECLGVVQSLSTWGHSYLHSSNVHILKLSVDFFSTSIVLNSSRPSLYRHPRGLEDVHLPINHIAIFPLQQCLLEHNLDRYLQFTSLFTFYMV